jgi:hypothetical protein
MNIPRYAAAAAKLLGKRVRGTELVAGDRERGIATIERAMQARVRRRRLVFGAGILASAAALLLVVQGARHLSTAPAAAPLVAINASPAGRGAALRAGDSDQPLSVRSQLGAGQRIETPPDGGASLKLSTGTSMDLSGSTSFQVDSQGAVQRFSLQRGELLAHVAKLTLGQRFIVATPDAEVEVRGTRFRTRVLEQAEACGDGSRTRLTVTEGVVEVRRAGTAILVRAGQHWPSDCASTQAPAAEKVVTAPAAGVADVVSKARGASAPERASALAEQNDLFAEGVALRRQGDIGGALRAYQTLMARFPKSPLAENALVERMRVLAATRDSHARDEAQLYLSRYPRGFAVKEARLLTAAP